MSDAPVGDRHSEHERRLVREFAALLYRPQSWYAGVVGPDGRIEYANEAARDVIDANARDLVGTFFWQAPWFTHDQDVQAAVREQVAAAVQGEASQFTATHRTSGGGTATVELELQPMPAPAVDGIDDHDHAFAVVVVGRRAASESTAADVESALDAVQALYAATDTDDQVPFDDRVRTALAVGADYLGFEEGFYTKIDAGTQFVRVSVGDHPLLQPGEQTALADTYCRETIADDAPTVVRDAGASAFADDTAYDVFGLECYIGAEIRRDGTTHGTVCFADRDAHPEPITAADEAFVGVLADWLERELRHRRERDQLTQQADRLGEFAGVVSHDLRSPLNAASGHLDLAAEHLDAGDTDGRASDAIENAHAAIDRMTDLVAGVHELAAQGDVVGDPAAVSVASVAADAAATALPDAATLTVDIGADVRLAADPERLRTVFENLFRNAAEHGGETVSVSVRRVDPHPDAGGAGFVVSDDGPGFGDLDPEAAFEPGLSTRAGGSGYGLRIVRAVVNAHGWTVTAADAPDGGARFEIRGVEFTPDC
ncbi:PAS domain-containing sensor histidine kinase [Halobacterium salinarum]|uniref:histidine kinase n=1 Tax=Halobacterium salinarum (strain ATCC 33171 / DSM 3754 / JCM 8978 / NBRC 102687 / NCIMB 764 / 91-R6) TaxID=2597657 RepID=A0A4D6GRW2_HALS9|nr:PAS domain-containing sensor histidine kinase [Halobacterium salinarum]MDL0124139.1 PAS domain-containing protein [Halobacterium salinarum]MDL0136152.1 PAS domain-containing protein [Halobacterium salinarum]MDL0144330.1 PAS domain-containing protein [Halobacterium salinarum]QCC44480.1 sensor box histidine kinase [Halobacterium salinarum]TYO76472.1 His Kinase A (phospho-acceptor) domain-containing protein [Halobacterium salinarum DSM 3754]